MHSLRSVRRSFGLWAILTALSLGSLPAQAAQPQTVEGTDLYLWMDPGLGQPNPGGRVRTHVQAIAMVHFDTPLLQGRLQWEGDFNVDLYWNGSAAVSGSIELGTWDFTQTDPDTNLPLFTATSGRWVTRAEIHGNFDPLGFNTGYVGICVAHGISGPVEGMVAVLRFTGGPAMTEFGLTLADVYEDGQIIIPQAAK